MLKARFQYILRKGYIRGPLYSRREKMCDIAQTTQQTCFKDYRGVNFNQKMEVLQNQWWLKGGKIVDETRALYLCVRFARYATNTTHAPMIYA